MGQPVGNLKFGVVIPIQTISFYNPVGGPIPENLYKLSYLSKR